MTGYPRPPDRNDTNVVGARIGAQIIDSIIVVIIIFVSLAIFGGIGAIGGRSAAMGGLFVGLFFGFVGSILYGLLLEGAWDGYTVGKKIFGIKVVKEDGSACDYGSAFVRNLLEIIDGLVYYLVGFIAMAMSDKRQRIGDRLAGTVVVREEPTGPAEPERRSPPDSSVEEEDEMSFDAEES